MAHPLERYRPLFPACEKYVYLNHAGVSLPSTRVRDAVHAWMDDLLHHGLAHEQNWEGKTEEARVAAATLVGASTKEIAFVRNTSHGLGLVAEGLDWKDGDEVAVAASIEYPSNVYPWLHLKDRGVRVREVEPVRGGVTPEAVERAFSPRTRLVAVSSAQYASGHRTDLEALGRICHERGALLCVDGIQTIGAMPIDVKKAGIHFLSADSHKWMLGLNGSGFLFVDESVLERVRPVLVGWKSTTDAWNFDRAHFELKPDAAKFEEGSPAYSVIHGMGAALGLLHEVGSEPIAGRIGELLAYLEKKLLALGCEVGPAPAERAGILSFIPPEGKDAQVLMEKMAAAGISVSFRRGRVRVSPHFFNREAELDAVAEVVASL